MTTPTYIVHDHCHICGRMHLVGREFPLLTAQTGATHFQSALHLELHLELNPGGGCDAS